MNQQYFDQLVPMEPIRDETQPEKIECQHQFKFDHAAYYGSWDMYKCTKCGYQKMKYWA